MIKHTNLICILNSPRTHLLLAEKLRGLGKGKFNGPGGHIEEGEDPFEAAVRECAEEFHIQIQKENLLKVAEQLFHFSDRTWHNTTFLTTTFEGNPRASDDGEMAEPQWFPIFELPFERMWQDDKHWLLQVLEGKRLSCEFWFAEDNETIRDFKISEV
jgi:8-oxo-dGTP diphosphatase